MKRNLISALLCCTVVLMALAACGDNDRLAPGGEISSDPVSSTSPSSFPESEIHALDVMYVPLDDGSAMYFSQPDDGDNALVLRLPEDLRDENGEAITQEDLNRGDILRLSFSNGYTIGTTWPGQLFTEADYAQVLHRGKPEDADKYQDAVDSFYQPDPVHIPSLQFTHIDGMAARGGTLAAEEGSYEWDCTDENDEPTHLSQEADHPLLREDLPQIPMSGPFPLELWVEEDVKEWEVRRWDASQKGDESLPEGELVTLTPGTVTVEGIAPPEEDAPTPPVRAVVEDAAPGQIYRVTAKWEEGWVCYDFEIYQDEG